MLTKISEAAARAWGAAAINAIGVLSAEIGKEGFEGPMKLTREPSLPFLFKATPAIQVLMSVSSSRDDDVGKVIDAHLSIWSKTLLDQAVIESFHSPEPPEKWLRGFEPCLGMSLSHMVWAEASSPENPRWHLVSGVPRGIESFVTKVRQHFLPVCQSLRDGDGALLALLERAQLKAKPAWVLSSPPGFAQLELRAAMLRRGISTRHPER